MGIAQIKSGVLSAWQHAQQQWATIFANEHIVAMDMLPALSDRIKREALLVLETDARRRDVNIATTGDTPRAYHSVGRDVIKQQCKLIPAFFESPEVLELLSTVAGEPLYRVPYKPEEYIVNCQSRQGDTHGWHWDDYAYALVWVVEAPDLFSGGRVEFIPHVNWDKDHTHRQMLSLLENSIVISKHIKAGQCYLLKARYALHRVAPLVKPTRRTVIVFTYANRHDLSDETISHETMEAIYAPEIGGTN